MEYEINEIVNELENAFDPNVMDDDELQGIVGKEIEDARDYIDNTVSPIRASATQYYRGDRFGNEKNPQPNCFNGRARYCAGDHAITYAHFPRYRSHGRVRAAKR